MATVFWAVRRIDFPQAVAIGAIALAGAIACNGADSPPDDEGADETSSTGATSPGTTASSSNSDPDTTASTTTQPPTASDSGTSDPGTSDDDSADEGSDTGEPGGCGQGGGGEPPGGFEPNPMFADLAAGEALDLGAYECAGRVPQFDERCQTIFDYSRLNYDPYMHRVLLFGGGHAATGRTDIDVFSFGDLTWSSMYPSMSCEEVAEGNLDPRGFHVATGHPVARHTYDQNVVVEVDGVGQLLMLSTEGFAGTCHQYNAAIRSVAYIPLDGCDEWSYSQEFELPWAYASSAEFDPVSGMVIAIGNTRGAGEGGMWVYDPGNHEVVAYVDEIQYTGIDGNLVYSPVDDRMYGIADTTEIWEVTLNRDDWSASTSVLRAPSGDGPSYGRNYAYDSNAQVIGGAVTDGTFYAYDPVANEWCSKEMAAVSSEGNTVGTVAAHQLDYNPVDNVHIFVDDAPRTWAYRFAE